MPDFTDTEIDRAFKIAGVVHGRPTADNPPPVIYPSEGASLIALFDDDMIDYLEHISEKSVTLFAANILQCLHDAELTATGRSLDITSATLGATVVTYQSGAEQRAGMQKVIENLRRQHRLQMNQALG